MSNIKNKKILLGITGGIAGYKSAELCRLLIKQQAEVRVCMTQSATEFISPLTLQALSTKPVHTDLFDHEAEAAMGHIELAKWADIIIIAPATANTIAKIAHGFADNLLTTIILASHAKLYIAPAMNQNMWQQPQTQQNIQQLASLNIKTLGPAHGIQACGDTGMGRMLEAREIIAELAKNTPQTLLTNTTILITAGPTQEALDPVRYLSNRSSGKMGYAIAKAALQMGAKVRLISGPVNLPEPIGVETIKIQSAQQLLTSCQQYAGDSDIFIATAAVADFRPIVQSQQKIKKQDDRDKLTIELTKNPDILATISHDFPHLFTLGFAAETEQLITSAKKKLKSKKLDMIAANQVGDNLGFEKNDNAIELIWHDGQISLPMMDKQNLAFKLLSLLAKHYRNCNAAY
ncbi:MAG: bifunctional phosphopantothenoylcysteine decarboxylase/phosphopantothenate--cysteine ligase CoaBC [Thiotrichaceae bacterium]|nr:bifunctional phosphopantothenoylcysteine decarboxylase/phosphopantothenate--cysteine ligase CoaBC [Thiotrichaceae bacterium]